MRIDKEQVKHTAALARLRIDESDMENWCKEMGAIIEFADGLNALELGDMNAVNLQDSALFNVFRDDRPDRPYSSGEILANAPQQYDGCYIVPKIVE